MMLHAVSTLPFWLSVARNRRRRVSVPFEPELDAKLRPKAGVLVTILEEKYGLDRFYDWFFAGGVRRFGNGLWRFGDVTVIDGLMVKRFGEARRVVRRGGAPGPVRIHLPLRVLHDHRRFHAAHLFHFFRGTLVP